MYIENIIYRGNFFLILHIIYISRTLTQSNYKLAQKMHFVLGFFYQKYFLVHLIVNN